MHFEAPRVSARGSETPSVLTMVEEWLEPAQMLKRSQKSEPKRRGVSSYAIDRLVELIEYSEF